MKVGSGYLVLLWMVITGCSEDPARSVKISRHASLPSRNANASIPTPDADWYREFCPPPAEDASGPSKFQATGPCGFQQRSAVYCESSQDDFIIGFVRAALHGATVATYLNVENYHGPGSYEGTQIFVAVQSGRAIYRWSNDNARAAVGPGEAFLTIPETSLEVEPMLLACTDLIGPATNYQFQCAARGAQVAIRSTAEIVSGTLVCAQPPK